MEETGKLQEKLPVGGNSRDPGIVPYEHIWLSFQPV